MLTVLKIFCKSLWEEEFCGGVKSISLRNSLEDF